MREYMKIVLASKNVTCSKCGEITVARFETKYKDDNGKKIKYSGYACPKCFMEHMNKCYKEVFK